MNKLLETIEDKDGNEMQVYSGSIMHSPAFTSMLRAYAELVDSKLAPGRYDFDNGDSMLWVQYPEGPILGGMCFNVNEDWNLINLKMGWTEKEYRSMGINTICHKWLAEEAKNRGLPGITSMVHVNNEMRLRSAAKVDLYPMFYVMYKKVV